MAREWRVEREGDDEHRQDERWLITYADMITVLMIFFIVMYALSAKISAKNFEKMAKSLQTALAKKTKEKKVENPIAPDIENTPLSQESQDIKRALAPFKGKSQVRVDLNDHGLVISLADTSFFDLGSTELKPDGKAALAKIAEVIATASNGISVQGHTDDTKAANGKTGSGNWVIASQRAASVAQFLSTSGKIPAKRFEIVSYGEYKPLFPNDSPEHRAMNRRVDIVVQEGPPKPAMTPGPNSSTDTLPPAFQDPNRVPTPPPTFNHGNEGGAVPNPFGNSF
jgi:chemotaxis protein MotB